MGLTGSKEIIARRKIDEATSNSSLSNLRYVINADKSKWKIFRKREVAPIPAYPASLKPMKGCPCGNNGPCKQKVTPRGVTIHYPQKKGRFSKFGASRGYLPPKKETIYRARTNQQVAHQRLDEASILHFVTRCDYKGETVLCELPVNYKVIKKVYIKNIICYSKLLLL